MPGRREFLIGCGCAVSAPAFAAIPLLAAAGSEQSARAVAAPLPISAAQADAIEPSALAWRIDGWDAPSDADAVADGQVWIRVNASWRASWR